MFSNLVKFWPGDLSTLPSGGAVRPQHSGDSCQADTLQKVLFLARLAGAAEMTAEPRWEAGDAKTHHPLLPIACSLPQQQLPQPPCLPPRLQRHTRLTPFAWGVLSPQSYQPAGTSAQCCWCSPPCLFNTRAHRDAW